ncbi:MAG TPA: N-acetyltransferase [Bacillales bacterium]|nr:N-acetyltransferase [Bacillales bacterium]
MTAGVKSTPWDERAFGIATFALDNANIDTLEMTDKPGHYTVKVDPLQSKKTLHEHGFYYCDTLMQPFLTEDRFQFYKNSLVGIDSDLSSLDELSAIANNVFRHDRFHRDFNLSASGAGKRYHNWLRQIHREGQVWPLKYDRRLAGFLASKGGHILLYGVKREFQSGGLSKYFWSEGCKKLFSEGHRELSTSVSASNLAMVNLVVSLGFRFREAVDVYHKYIHED